MIAMKGSTTIAAAMVVSCWLILTSLCCGEAHERDDLPSSARRVRARNTTKIDHHADQELDFVKPNTASSRYLQDGTEFRNNDFTGNPVSEQSFVHHIVNSIPTVLDFDLGLGTPAVEGEPQPEMAARDGNECPSNKWCDDNGIDNSLAIEYVPYTMHGHTSCMRFLVCGKNPERNIQMAIYRRNSHDELELAAADANDLIIELDGLPDRGDKLVIQLDGVNGATEYGHVVIASCEDAADPYEYCPTEPSFLRPKNENFAYPEQLPYPIDDETLPFPVPYSNLYARSFWSSTIPFDPPDFSIEDESGRTSPCEPGKWCDGPRGWDNGVWFALNFTSPSRCVQVVTCDDKDMQLIALTGSWSSVYPDSVIALDDDGGKLPNTPRLVEVKPPAGNDYNWIGLDGFKGTRSEGLLVFAACDDQDPYLRCPPATSSCVDREPAEAALKLAIKAGQHEVSGRLTAKATGINKCDDGDAAAAQPGLVYSVEGNGKPITVTTCDLGVKPSFRIDLSVMQCNAESGKDDCVAISKQGRCGHGMHVTFDTVKGETYDVLLRGANVGGTGKFAIQSFQLAAPSQKNIKRCAAELEKACPNIGCPNWTKCKIKKIAASCTHSKACHDKCKTWWACTRTQSRGTGDDGACSGMSPALSVRLEEAKAARNVLIEKINIKCGSNLPTVN